MFPAPKEDAKVSYSRSVEVLPSVEAATLRGHDGPALAVRFNAQGTYLMSAGKDRSVRLWNPHKGLLVKSYAGHGYEVRDVAIARDNKTFASCGGDKALFFWDVASGRFLRKFRGHDSTINAVVYAGPADELLVTAGYDQCLRVWDCKSRSIDAVQTMKAFQDSVTGVAVSGHEITACSVDGTVRRFDARMGRAYSDRLHAPVTGLALSHDNLCVLVACLGSTLRLLDKATGEMLAAYRGHVHESVSMDCCLTPSDAHVVGSSETGEILYWDLVETEVVKRFQAHPGVVCSLAMHPAGTALATSSVDGSIRVWR